MQNTLQGNFFPVGDPLTDRPSLFCIDCICQGFGVGVFVVFSKISGWTRGARGNYVARSDCPEMHGSKDSLSITFAEPFLLIYIDGFHVGFVTLNAISTIPLYLAPLPFYATTMWRRAFCCCADGEHSTKAKTWLFVAICATYLGHFIISPTCPVNILTYTTQPYIHTLTLIYNCHI